MAHPNDNDNNAASSAPYVQVPPETYNCLIHALLSLQGSSLPNHNHPWPPAIAPPPTTASTVQEPEGLEDATSIVEDKRRRNTAASARFRVKKKLKTLNLERTVGDLTGRTEELEREAAGLRRENAWLKEIVFLKGRNLVALPANRHDDGGEEEQEPKSSVNRREKGKDKES